jgi:hypothetical protein
MSWSANKDHMLKLEKAGKATAGQKAWLAKWRAAGSPSTKAGMTAKPTPAPAKPAVGKDVVGADGLTNAERYKKRQAEKAAKAAAEKARIAKIDKDRPEGVSRYLWEKVLNGDSNFNKALVSKNPEISDAIAAAGHGDWVKAIHEQAMDEAANHYMGNGADASAAYATAQNPWYKKNHGSYKNETVSNTGNDELGFGGSTGAPSNPGYVAPEVPKPVVEESPATSGNPGGMFGNLTGQVQDTRPPEETPPPGGAITGPTQEEMLAAYEEKLAAAQAAQQAAYQEQLAAQQAQYDQQVAAQQAAKQAEIDRRNAEKAAAQAANKQSWSNANAAAAGAASSSPAYTKKYGQGSNAGGLMAGVGSVRGNSNRTADVLPTGGARPSGPPTGGFKPNDDTGFGPQPGAPKPSHQPSTPWADAFVRSKKAAEAPGPVSGMMSKWME